MAKKKETEKISQKKVLLPKNSGLRENAVAALKELGDSGNNEVLEFRGEDIPFLLEQFIGKGEKAIGITGEDLFREYCMEKQTSLEILKRFSWKADGFLFGKPCLCLISPPKNGWKEQNIVAVNSKYSRLGGNFLEKFRREGIKIETIEFNGNTELAMKKGLADKCIEIVCTGATMKNLGLVVEEKIFESDLVLIGEKQKSGRFDLEALFKEIEARKESNASESYTKKLFDDSELLSRKFNEECFELLSAFKECKRPKIVWEACDVLYFLAVMLAKSNATVEELWNELERRNNEKKKKN